MSIRSPTDESVASHAAGSVTSSITARPPMSAATRSAPSASMSTMTTDAPAAASRRAMPSPIPVAAPVTIAERPERSNSAAISASIAVTLRSRASRTGVGRQSDGNWVVRLWHTDRHVRRTPRTPARQRRGRPARHVRRPDEGSRLELRRSGPVRRGDREDLPPCAVVGGTELRCPRAGRVPRLRHRWPPDRCGPRR